MDFITATIADLTLWLSAHQNLAYAVLFLGAYFETLIGLSFFIPGELFFIPGAILAGTGVLDIAAVSAALYLGGILGDSSSYWIGRKASGAVLRFFKAENKIFSEKNYRRGEQFFKAHGPKAIFFARIAGPFSWVTPFLAGTYGVPYRTFLTYNVPGVVVGIGEFLVLGYLFGDNYESILSLIQTSMWLVVLSVVLAVGGWFVVKKHLGTK